MLTQELVKELFDYKDGELFWKIKPSKRIKAGRAGCYDSKGYVVIKINKKKYYAHRLIWTLHHYIPVDCFIDHINGNKSDNRIENLREASMTQNKQNVPKNQRLSCSSQYKGASWNKQNKKWQSHIRINGKSKHLGNFSSETEAAAVYDMNAIKYFGEFANPNFKCPIYNLRTTKEK